MKNKLKKILSIGLLSLSFLLLPSKVSASGKVSITFDDGNGSTFENALPILKRYKIPATVFVVADDVGDKGMLTWHQLRSLQDRYGWEIGNHSKTHPKLSTLTNQQIASEVNTSLNTLLSHGLNSTSFATPYGDYDNRVLAEILKSHNLHRGFWERQYLNETPYNKATIMSQSVQQGTTIEEVISWIERAVAEDSWLVLVFHEILPEVDDFEYTNTTQELKDIVKYIDESEIQVVLPNHTLSKSSENLVSNNSFNDSLGQWKISNSNSIYKDTGNNGSYPDATNSVRFGGNSFLSYLLSNQIEVTNKTEYSIDTFVNTSGLQSGELGFYIDEYDNANNWISGKWLGKAVNGTVQYFSKSYTPSSPSIRKVSLQVYLTPDSNGSVFIDNVGFYNLYPNIVPTPITNKVLNPSFENSDSNNWITNWSRDNNVFTIDSLSKGDDGSKSIFVGENTSKGHMFSDKIAVTSDQSYLWSTYLNSSGTGEFGFYIDEYDASGDWLSGQWKGMISDSINNNVTFSYSPKNVNIAYISLQYYVLENNNFNLYLDSVSFAN